MKELCYISIIFLAVVALVITFQTYHPKLSIHLLGNKHIEIELSWWYYYAQKSNCGDYVWFKKRKSKYIKL